MRISLFVSGLIILLLFGVFGGAFAATCKYIGDSPPVENTNDCDFSILITDPGGAGLEICRYKIVTTGGNPGDPAFWNSDWNNPGSCVGDFGTMTKTIQIPESFSAGDYDIHWYAEDHSNNIAQGLFDTFRVVTLPTVSTQAATNVSGTQATLNGTLESLGGASNATVWFEWGTSTSYGSSTTPVTKTSTGPFSASLSNLIGGTTYHFRAVAQYAGTAYGADQQFTTLDITAPEYQSFRVNNAFCNGDLCPATVTATSGPLDITWSASDSGGSGVNRHELWRAPDAGGSPGSWGPVPGKDNFPPATTSTTDTPPNNGTWWYGMHTVDNANNCITERKTFCPGGVQSDNVTRTAHGPIKVIFGDQEFPTISSFIVSPRPPSWVNSASPNVSVTWTVADETGGSYLKEVTILRCDKSTVSQCGANDWQNIKTTAAPPNSTSWSGSLSPQDTPPEGKSWYGMHVWDNAGHKTVEPPPGPLDVQIDKTKPSIPTNLQPTGTVTSQSVLFDWSDATDNLSGVASYRLQVDQNSQFNNPEINTSTSVSSYSANVDEGNQYWRVWAIDNATNGDELNSANASFNHQTNDPPSASFSCTPSNCTVVFSSTPLTFNNNSTDPDGSGDITRSEWDILNYGNAPDLTCTSPALCGYTLPLSTPVNTYTMQLKVQDSAGNSDTETKIFIVQADSTAPTIDSFSISPTTWTNGNITVSWTANDSDSGIQEVEVWRAPDSGGSPGTWTNIKDNAASPFVDSPAEGQWWYGIHVIDNTGNCIKEDTSGTDKGHCGGVTSDTSDTRPDKGPLKAQVDKTAPPQPTNLQPTGTVRTACIDFNWDDVSDISGILNYRFQLDQNSQFNNPEIDAFPTASTYNSCNVGSGTQYWRVWAVNGASLSGNSASAQIDYQPNQSPNASFNCTPANCTIFNTETLTFNNNSTDPDGSGDITRSEWDILSWGASPDATCTSPNALCDHTLQPITPNTYTMQLKVQDIIGATDTDTRSFTVKRDIVAGFMCSLDNVNFVACTSLSGQISQGEALYLKDSSALGEYTIVSEGASSVTSRTWKINGTPFGGNSANPSTTIPTQGTITLELTAQDNQGRSDTQTHTLNPQVPFPEFQEISPF